MYIAVMLAMRMVRERAMKIADRVCQGCGGESEEELEDEDEEGCEGVVVGWMRDIFYGGDC